VPKALNLMTIKKIASAITYILISSVSVLTLILGFGFLDYLMFDSNNATYQDYLENPVMNKWRFYCYLCLSTGIGFGMSISISKYALFKSGVLTKAESLKFFGK
jgi:Na+/H+ antiporter NhaA